MEIVGHIHQLYPTKDVNVNYQEREVVIKTEEQYPQYLLISFFQDKCNLLNPYNVGDYVSVSINIKGKEWVSPQGETKYFNKLDGWKIFQLQK